MSTLTRPGAPVDALRRRRGWTLIAMALGAALLVLGLLVALLVTTVTIVGTGKHSEQHTAQVPVPLQAPPSIVSEVPSDDLALPQPTGYADGIPAGYPNTQLGAVAAAYGYSRIATGLDVQATLRTLEHLADPTTDWFARSRAEIADGLVDQRKDLGLPPTGSAGMALINVTPSAYRVETTGPRGVTVLILNQVSAESTNGAMTSGTVVFRWALRWDGARWVVGERFTDPRDDKLAAVPFTSTAAANGWKAARGG